MRLVLQIARDAAGEDCPIACIIIRNGCEVARAVNEVEARGDPTAHAELLCIQRACSALKTRYLDDCILYCTLEPCPMCEWAINLARVGAVVFGAFRSGYSICYKQDINNSSPSFVERVATTRDEGKVIAERLSNDFEENQIAEIGKEGRAGINAPKAFRSKIIGGVLEKECSELLSSFFLSVRKINQ